MKIYDDKNKRYIIVFFSTQTNEKFFYEKKKQTKAIFQFKENLRVYLKKERRKHTKRKYGTYFIDV